MWLGCPSCLQQMQLQMKWHVRRVCVPLIIIVDLPYWQNLIIAWCIPSFQYRIRQQHITLCLSDQFIARRTSALHLSPRKAYGMTLSHWFAVSPEILPPLYPSPHFFIASSSYPSIIRLSLHLDKWQIPVCSLLWPLFWGSGVFQSGPYKSFKTCKGCAGIFSSWLPTMTLLDGQRSWYRIQHPGWNAK